MARHDDDFSEAIGRRGVVKPVAGDTADFASPERPVIAAWLRSAVLLLGWNLTIPFVFRRPSRLAATLLFLGSFVPICVTFGFLGDTTPVWVSNAVIIAILLRNPLATWPALLLVGTIAEFFASLLFGHGITESAWCTVFDIADVVLVSLALRRIETIDPLFSSIEQISRFALVNLLVPVVGATGGALLLTLHDGLPFIEMWISWYLSLVFGQLVVVPFLLMWIDTAQTFNIPNKAKWEVAFLALLVGVAGAIDFGVQALPGLFLSFPFLLLAAFRGGVLGATTAAVVLTLVASTLTLLGWGPIAMVPGSGLTAHLLLLQLYLAMVLLSSLPVAVMLEQRKLLSAADTLTELTHMARHDVLTGLPNRMLFQERLVWTQAQAYEQGGHTALVLLDLDRFKPVNDLHGHAAGDRLLQMVGDRIRSTVRAGDSVARLGGDEFAIVGQVDGPATAQILAQRVVTELSRPFEIANLTLEIGCSAGIALSLEASLDNELLVQRADAALYRAKAEGRNCCRFFEPGMEVRIRERAKLEAELRQAIAHDDLVPYFQPIVRLDTAKPVGFEMLARWTHSTLGEIPPSVFVPVAETASLMGRLTEQLLRRACFAALTWPDDLFLSINVSPVQLRDRKLPGLVRSILAETGLPPQRLEVELTESALIDDFELARTILMDLKTTGIRLALDDFGTGYSSLNHLQKLPLDKVKIDMGFVRSMMGVAASRTIVAGVIALSHSLDLPIVAEGVEDDATAGALNLMGCDFGQGILYGRPTPAEGVTAMLRQVIA